MARSPTRTSTLELGQVVAGRKPGRQDDDEIIILNPTGLGLHDIAMGKRVYEAASKASGRVGETLQRKMEEVNARYDALTKRRAELIAELGARRLTDDAITDMIRYARGRARGNTERRLFHQAAGAGIASGQGYNQGWAIHPRMCLGQSRRGDQHGKARRGNSNCVYGINDPYMPIEAEWNLTGRALEILAEHRFPVHIITKSDLVLKDLATLLEINRVYAAVSFTITTADDALCKKIEPGAPPTSKRFAAMRVLADNGIYTGVTMMPILPFIEGSAENIAAIVEQARDAGARYILAAFGMTMRDRQRAHFYDKLDQSFPGVRQQYERRYGERYSCRVPNAARLEKTFRERCAQFGIATKIRPYQPETHSQLRLM